MNYMQIDKCDVANGVGVGVVLWVSGCNCHCLGCHNPQSWDFNAGQPFTEDTMQELLEALDKPYISRLTLSGGHPLEYQNINTVYRIVKTVKEKFPNKTIWLYTGYTWEEILEQYKIWEDHEVNGICSLDVVSYCDVLVDGRYEDDKRDISLAWRGSSNQNIWEKIKNTWVNITKTYQEHDMFSNQIFTGIYKITNIKNNKCYIGQSTDIINRFYQHKQTKKTNKHLFNSISKYGLNAFTFEIIELCETCDLNEREKYWIQFYHSTSPLGYNLTDGGDGGNTFQYRSSEEMSITKNKISEATRGEKNGFYGRHHSQKTRDYLREINLNKKMSDETKRKLSISLQGHYMPESAKQKIRNATKIQWQDENYRSLMSAKAKGNQYAKGNKWSIGRVDIYNANTLEHKRVKESELEYFLNNGFRKGIPPNDKRYNPKRKRCSNDNLIGVFFDKNSNKWAAYISYKKKRYGYVAFITKDEAILHRRFLELLLDNLENENINLDDFKKYSLYNNDNGVIDIKESLKQNSIVLFQK